jgi:hypothetical protein
VALHCVNECTQALLTTLRTVLVPPTLVQACDGHGSRLYKCTLQARRPASSSVDTCSHACVLCCDARGSVCAQGDITPPGWVGRIIVTALIVIFVSLIPVQTARIVYLLRCVPEQRPWSQRCWLAQALAAAQRARARIGQRPRQLVLAGRQQHRGDACAARAAIDEARVHAIPVRLHECVASPPTRLALLTAHRDTCATAANCRVPTASSRGTVGAWGRTRAAATAIYSAATLLKEASHHPPTAWALDRHMSLCTLLMCSRAAQSCPPLPTRLARARCSVCVMCRAELFCIAPAAAAAAAAAQMLRHLDRAMMPHVVLLVPCDMSTAAKALILALGGESCATFLKGDARRYVRKIQVQYQL